MVAAVQRFMQQWQFLQLQFGLLQRWQVRKGQGRLGSLMVAAAQLFIQ